MNVRGRSYKIIADVELTPGRRGRALRARLAVRRARAVHQGPSAALRLQLPGHPARAGLRLPPARPRPHTLGMEFARSPRRARRVASARPGSTSTTRSSPRDRCAHRSASSRCAATASASATTAPTRSAASTSAVPVHGRHDPAGRDRRRRGAVPRPREGGDGGPLPRVMFPSLRGYVRRGCAATSSPGSRSGRCSSRSRWPTPRSPASRPSSASTPRRRRCCSTPLFGSSRHLIVGPMSATAALSAAAVADLATGGAATSSRSPRRSPSRPGVVGAARRAAAPRLPRQLHLRAGAQGLHRRPRPDDHHRPGAEAARHREGRRRLLRAALGRPQPPRRHARPDARRRARLPRASCSALRRFAPVVPGVAGRGRRSASSPSSCSTSTTTASTIVGHIDSGLPVLGLPDGARFDDYLEPRRGRGRRHARRLRRGARRGQDLRRPAPLRRSTPTASCSASAPPTSAPACRQRHGRQRQPVEDRRQRRRRRQDRSCRAWSSRC